MSVPTYLGSATFWKSFVTPNRYSFDKIPDLSGKVAIVSGANTGIGYAITVSLAAHGCHVVMACRSESKCRDAMIKIREEVATIANKYANKSSGKGKAATTTVIKNAEDVKLDFLELDNNDLSKVQAAAQTFLKRGLPLHILINNAGIMGTPFTLSVDGIEQQFAVNYVAVFAFTMALLDRMKESQPSRIVIVNSMGHEMSVPGGINIDRINDESEGKPSSRYGRSKFACMLFMRALNRRLSSSPDTQHVYVNCAHPGMVDTEMCYHSGDSEGFIPSLAMRIITKTLAYTPMDGALTPLYCATSPEIEEFVDKKGSDDANNSNGIKGRYFIPVAKELRPSKLTNSIELQESVWAYTEKLVAEKLQKA
ncbi:hypothetical protein BGZ99_006273 [Dissophora globulifera]|uniref:NAD(P)-binding protein n=1 Tax=Dissophora globulifera TaxID=979702 RepID=A0A9P6RWE9_9FUNG|nr:hypothetical protein BGZ99_006273 [Dissophora globulifera]